MLKIGGVGRSHIAPSFIGIGGIRTRVSNAAKLSQHDRLHLMGLAIERKNPPTGTLTIEQIREFNFRPIAFG